MTKSTINRHLATLPPNDQATLRLIERLGQWHLVESWPEPGQEIANIQRLLAQVRVLDAGYPGGLKRYLDNAKELLEQAKQGDTPYQGYSPQVPEGFRIDFGSAQFSELEERGLNEVHRCGFALVAGGLGERLGFPGVKPALSAESATGRSFLGLYAAHLLAFQRRTHQRFGEERQLPLAIMTSDDTDAGIKQLLRDNRNFGLKEAQVAILKQERVAAIADPTPLLAINPSDPYEIVTKPHGHGDMHALIHQARLAELWLAQGLRWVVFFQDTNSLTFNAVLAALGVSAREHLDVNSIAVPRHAGEAAGGLVRLVKPGSELTLNVEYNQLDALLRAIPGGNGDVPDQSGYSPFPANINVFILALAPYAKTLEKTGGAVPEFVNPKYTDDSRTSFKSATRLECMMQDYPRLVDGARVGVTQFERSICFSPAKNNLDDGAARQSQNPPLPVESASTAEADLYAFHRRVLRLAGAEIEEGSAESYQGIKVVVFPIVLISPILITPVASLLKNVTGVRISSRSALVIDADAIVIQGLELDGALEIRAVQGARIILKDLVVKNRGWVTRNANESVTIPAELAIRGFYLDKRETLLLEANEPGEYVVDSLCVANSTVDPTRPQYRIVTL